MGSFTYPLVSVGTPSDALLVAISGLTTAADQGMLFTGVDTVTTFGLTPAGRAILDDANAGAQRNTLGVGVSQVPQFAGTILDSTSLEALLVRRLSDSGDVLAVDTTNYRVTIGSAADVLVSPELVLYGLGNNATHHVSTCLGAERYCIEANGPAGGIAFYLKTAGQTLSAWDSAAKQIFNVSAIGEILSYATANTYYAGFRAATTPTQNTVYSLPTAYPVTQSSVPLVSTAGALSWLAPVNSAVLISSGAGLPSWATSLPSALTIPAPIITGVLDLGGITSLEIPNAAAPSLTVLGQVALDTTDSALILHDGVGAKVYAHPVNHFTVTIEADASWDSETIPLWQAPKDMAITITQVNSTCLGGTSLTFNIEERPWAGLASAGTVITAAAIVADADGTETTSFSNGGIAAKAHLVLTTGASAASGLVTAVTITFYYTRDIE